MYSYRFPKCLTCGSANVLWNSCLRQSIETVIGKEVLIFLSYPFCYSPNALSCLPFVACHIFTEQKQFTKPEENNVAELVFQVGLWCCSRNTYFDSRKSLDISTVISRSFTLRWTNLNLYHVADSSWIMLVEVSARSK